MAGDTLFVPATQGHVLAVARDLCPEERETLRDMGAEADAERIALTAAAHSAPCYAALRVGRPIAVFGALPSGADGGLWFLATPEAFAQPIVMVREGRRMVREMLARYDRLVGAVDARRDGVHKWLRLLGFEVGVPTAERVPMRPYRIERRP